MTGIASLLTESSTVSASRTSASQVERAAFRIAVAALIPRHHAEAAGGEQRREYVVGAREIEAAVREQQRRRLLVAPLVNGDAEATRIHETPSSRRLGTRIRDGFGM